MHGFRASAHGLSICPVGVLPFCPWYTRRMEPGHGAKTNHSQESDHPDQGRHNTKDSQTKRSGIYLFEYSLPDWLDLATSDPLRSSPPDFPSCRYLVVQYERKNPKEKQRDPQNSGTLLNKSSKCQGQRTDAPGIPLHHFVDCEAAACYPAIGTQIAKVGAKWMRRVQY